MNPKCDSCKVVSVERNKYFVSLNLDGAYFVLFVGVAFGMAPQRSSELKFSKSRFAPDCSIEKDIAPGSTG